MFHKLSDRSQKGQGLVEYALILVLVAVVVIVILSFLGPAIGGVFSDVLGSMGGVNPVTGGSGFDPDTATAAEKNAALNEVCGGQPAGTAVYGYTESATGNVSYSLVNETPPGGWVNNGVARQCEGTLASLSGTTFTCTSDCPDVFDAQNAAFCSGQPEGTPVYSYASTDTADTYLFSLEYQSPVPYGWNGPYTSTICPAP